MVVSCQHMFCAEANIVSVATFKHALLLFIADAVGKSRWCQQGREDAKWKFNEIENALVKINHLISPLSRGITYPGG